MLTLQFCKEDFTIDAKSPSERTMLRDMKLLNEHKLQFQTIINILDYTVYRNSRFFFF